MGARDTLVLDVEINRETALAAAESARSAFASGLGNSPFLGGGQQGGMPFFGMRSGNVADSFALGGYSALGMMPGGGPGTPAGGVPNYPFFGGAAPGTMPFGTTTIPSAASAIPQTTLGQLGAATLPGMFAPSNMPPQFFGAAMQTQFQERVGYGLAQGALGLGASAMRWGGAAAGSVGGASLGGYIGQQLGGETGAYIGSSLGANLGGPIGEALGEFVGLPLTLASERLGNERAITNVFRSQGYKAGLGPGVARRLQPTLRGMGEEIARASGEEDTPFYDPGALARGEDPAERAAQMTQMALSSGALGRGLDYRRPGELLGRLGRAHSTMMMFERNLNLSLPEAGGAYAALEQAGVYGDEEKRRFGAIASGIADTGLGEPGTSKKEQFESYLGASSMARQMGLPGGPFAGIAEREYARLGAAASAGYIPKEQMQMLGGQTGAAKQMAGIIARETSEDNPIGTNNLLMQASMRADGTVDMDKARQLAGQPIHKLVQEAQRNMMKSGMNPTEFLGLMEFNKTSMIQQLESEAPDILRSNTEGGLRGMAEMMQRQAGQKVGAEGPRVGYLQQAARQMGMSAEQARVFIGNMNQQTEGITEGLSDYTENVDKEAVNTYEQGLTGAWGRLKETMRRGGSDLARPLERAGEDIAEAIVRGLGSSDVLQELIAVLRSFVEGSRQGGSDSSKAMDIFRGFPNLSVGSSVSGGR